MGQRIAIAIAEKSGDRERFREAEDIDVLELFINEYADPLRRRECQPGLSRRS
jgi:hypothetical protein